jgi:hypothetical protein
VNLEVEPLREGSTAVTSFLVNTPPVARRDFTIKADKSLSLIDPLALGSAVNTALPVYSVGVTSPIIIMNKNGNSKNICTYTITFS